MAGRLLLLALVAALVAAAPAHAAILETRGFQGSETRGIAVGPDGNLWVGEPDTDSIVRMDRQGNVLQRYAVGGAAADIVSGPGGRVWAAIDTVESGGKLVWFDALAASPTRHDVDTTSVSDCDPVAVAAGGNGRIYVSLPNPGTCVDASILAHLADDGTGALTPVGGKGSAYDLEVSAGKLFVPDYDGNVVRRLTLNNSLTTESTVTIPTGGNPQGIASDGAGGIWTAQLNGHDVARFPASQNNGNAVVLTPSGGTLTTPFGIAAGPDGAMYVSGFNSANLARIDPATNGFTFFAAPPDAYPWRIVRGLDDDLWIADRGAPRLLRFVRGAPRFGTLNLGADSPTSAILDVEVDPRGSATQLVVDYGTTTAYGTTTSPVSIPPRVGLRTERVTLSGLSPGTQYHARVRATNADGEASVGELSFSTPPAPGEPPVVVPRPPDVVPLPPASSARGSSPAPVPPGASRGSPGCASRG